MEEDKKKWMTNSNQGGGWVVLFFIFLFIFSKWGPAIPFSVSSQPKGEPFMVSGQGKVFVTPDIAKISFGIQDNGPSLKAVESNVNTKSKALTQALKGLGIAEEDIKTTSYNVYPRYDYTNPESRITGFEVSIDYQVTVRDFDKVNDALSQGIAAGANVVGGVSFDVNDKTEKEKLNEARKLAVEDAKAKAQGLAGAAGITLGKVINVSENQGYGRPIPFETMAVDKAIGSAPAPEASVTPGTAEINITVSLSYEVR